MRERSSRMTPQEIQEYIQKRIGELSNQGDLTIGQVVVSYTQILMTVNEMLGKIDAEYICETQRGLKDLDE